MRPRISGAECVIPESRIPLQESGLVSGRRLIVETPAPKDQAGASAGGGDDRPGLGRRLLSFRVGAMFVRNTIVSCVAFAFDLVLLWALVEALAAHKLVAATFAFLAAITLHYALARSWIFPPSERGVTAGYIYFLINSTVGLVV